MTQHRPTAPAPASDPADFLLANPQPVVAGAYAIPDPDDLLPQREANQLLSIDGVDGAWIERTADGGREVVVHISRPDARARVPASAHGLATRIVGGRPIRAGG